ncbi:hypothetical protein Bpro_0376 [Polaromonas sp. JS666]|nr:hypothetical protein Bpro_0376 [Polaromonas sp. JS666]
MAIFGIGKYYKVLVAANPATGEPNSPFNHMTASAIGCLHFMQMDFLPCRSSSVPPPPAVDFLSLSFPSKLTRLPQSMAGCRGSRAMPFSQN